MRGIRFDALLKNISSFTAMLSRPVNADAAAGPAPCHGQYARAIGDCWRRRRFIRLRGGSPRGSRVSPREGGENSRNHYRMPA
jgi:hypothetical protein